MSVVSPSRSPVLPPTCRPISTHMYALSYQTYRDPWQSFLLFFFFFLFSCQHSPVSVTGWQAQWQNEFFVWHSSQQCLQPQPGCLLVFALKAWRRVQFESTLGKVFTWDRSVPSVSVGGVGQHFSEISKSLRQFSPLSTRRSAAALTLHLIIKMRW